MKITLVVPGLTGGGVRVVGEYADHMTSCIFRVLADPRLLGQIGIGAEARLTQFTWPNCIRFLEAADVGMVDQAPGGLERTGSESCLIARFDSSLKSQNIAR